MDGHRASAPAAWCQSAANRARRPHRARLQGGRAAERLEIAAAQRLKLLLQRSQKPLQIKGRGRGALHLLRQRPGLAVATQPVEQFHRIKSGHAPQLAVAPLCQGAQGCHGRFRIGGGGAPGGEQTPLRWYRPTWVALQELSHRRIVAGVMAGVGQEGAGQQGDGVLTPCLWLEQRQGPIELSELKAHIALDQTKPRRAPHRAGAIASRCSWAPSRAWAAASRSASVNRAWGLVGVAPKPERAGGPPGLRLPQERACLRALGMASIGPTAR